MRLSVSGWVAEWWSYTIVLCLVSTSFGRKLCSWLTVCMLLLDFVNSLLHTIIESISRSVQWFLSLMQWWLICFKVSVLSDQQVRNWSSLSLSFSKKKRKKKNLPDTSHLTLRTSTHPTHWIIEVASADSIGYIFPLCGFKIIQYDGAKGVEPGGWWCPDGDANATQI